jgi:hypothetical protein
MEGVGMKASRALSVAVGILIVCVFGVLGCSARTERQSRERATTAKSALTSSFVQKADALPPAIATFGTVPYTTAQTAGDVNVVVVGWGDTTATVTSVTDTAGNTYALAVGPTVQAGFWSQSIYYAKNIVASSANSVTVKFSSTTQLGLRILE